MGAQMGNQTINHVSIYLLHGIVSNNFCSQLVTDAWTRASVACGHELA
jgi:hypothetical protein